MSDVVIRPAQEADLAALVAMLADEDFFIDRLARQSAGNGLLLTPATRLLSACRRAWPNSETTR